MSDPSSIPPSGNPTDSDDDTFAADKEPSRIPPVGRPTPEPKEPDDSDE